MPAFRNEARAAGLASAALAALLVALPLLPQPALAQLGPPVRLVPPPPAATPAPATPAPDTGAGGGETLPSGVQATPLAPVDTAWIGTLAPADGGFPETFWQGTPRSFVVAALPLVQPTTSPVLQDLTRRLLLSNAVAPGGSDPADGHGLVAVRVERMVALGQVDGALAIMDRLPWKGDQETVDRLKVDLNLVKNDTDAACKQADSAIGKYQDVWWDRMQIACQALGGDQGKAQLGLSLLRERKAPRDQLFDTLIDAVGGKSAKIDRMPDPTPVRVTLLAAAKLPLPADALQAADPAVLHAWATNANVPNDRRLPAAERAAALGALPLDELRLLYTEISFKPEEAKTALQQASENPRARALLYTTAKQETVPAARAEVLQALLQAGAKRGELPVTARLVAPIVLEIPATPDLDWFAPLAARALYAADHPAEAARWAQLIDAAGQAQLLPVARMAAGNDGPAWPKGGLKDVLTGLLPKDGQPDPVKFMLAAALLSAAGEPVTANDWALLVPLPPTPAQSVPNVAVWLGGRDAAAGKRLGETVLDTLLMAHLGDRLSTEPDIIAEAVARLRAVGLEPEARRLAVEAALDAGL